MNESVAATLGRMEPLSDEEPNDLVRRLIPEAHIRAGTRIPDRVGTSSPYQRKAHLKQPIMSQEQMAKQQARAERIKKKLERKEKYRRCLELRKSGATYEQIATVVGYKSAQTVSRIIKKQLDETTNEAGNELRTLQIERLNHMMLVLWPKVQGGDLNAIDRFLRIQNEINNLQGVYAPQKTESTHEVTGGVLVIEGDKDDYIAALQRVAGRHEEQTNEPGTPALGRGDRAGGDDGADDITDAVIIEEHDPVLAPLQNASSTDRDSRTPTDDAGLACGQFVVSIDPKDQIRQKCGGCGMPRYKH